MTLGPRGKLNSVTPCLRTATKAVSTAWTTVTSPADKGHFKAISCPKWAEHVGIRHYPKFCARCNDLLDDDGTPPVFQVAGIRTNWQFEDLIWGLL